MFCVRLETNVTRLQLPWCGGCWNLSVATRKPRDIRRWQHQHTIYIAMAKIKLSFMLNVVDSTINVIFWKFNALWHVLDNIMGCISRPAWLDLVGLVSLIERSWLELSTRVIRFVVDCLLPNDRLQYMCWGQRFDDNNNYYLLNEFCVLVKLKIKHVSSEPVIWHKSWP